MTKEQYELCEKKWEELYCTKRELQERLNEVLREFQMVTKALNSPLPINEVPFPYKEI